MLIGYARVSTQEQDLSLQLDALKAAECEKMFEEKASGAQRERPALQAALAYMRRGDTLVVWKLDWLARSLKQLIETVEDLGERGIGLRSLTEAIDTTTSGGKLIFHIFAALGRPFCGIPKSPWLKSLDGSASSRQLSIAICHGPEPRPWGAIWIRLASTPRAIGHLASYGPKSSSSPGSNPNRLAAARSEPRAQRSASASSRSGAMCRASM
jgi:hypothetical protein